MVTGQPLCPQFVGSTLSSFIFREVLYCLLHSAMLPLVARRSRDRNIVFFGHKKMLFYSFKYISVLIFPCKKPCFMAHLKLENERFYTFLSYIDIYHSEP